MTIMVPSFTPDQFLRPLDVIRSEHDRQLLVCDRIENLANDRQLEPVLGDLGTRPPSCEDAADANDDGIIDISDVMATLGTLFLDDGPLPSPSGFRGLDPTGDALGCRR